MDGEVHSRAAAPGRLQRSRGRVEASFQRRGDATALARLRQEGCLKLRLPRPQETGWAEAILLNNAGGVAQGDDLGVAAIIGPAAQVALTTAAAERIYRSLPQRPPAVVSNRLEVGAGGAAEWLPQETILYDGASLRRRLDVSVAADARLLGVEMLVFGRTAMGESLLTLDLRDTIVLRLAGRLVLHEVFRPAAAFAATAGRAALGDATASATVFAVGYDHRLGAIRDLLASAGKQASAGIQAGASCWDGVLLVRLLSSDTAALRTTLIALLRLLRDERMLPRVWAC